MTGGPSQIDLFDPKPLLNTLDGQPLPPSFGKIHSQFLESDPLCLGSHRKWGKYGQSGMDMSDLVPHLHPHADDIALIRSCVADSVIHAPAMYQMNHRAGLHGLSQPGELGDLRPGLREREPAGLRRDDPARGDARRGRAVLGRRVPAGPSTRGRSSAAARRRSSTSSRRPSSRPPQQRRMLDLLRVDERAGPRPGRHRALGADRELRAGLPHAERRARGGRPLDASRTATKALYGLDDPRTVEFGTRCLLARRLVERGVRFVQLYSGGGPVAMQWDAHDDIDANHEKMCGLTDKPVAALLDRPEADAACSRRRWSSGAASSAGRRSASKGGRGRDHNATGFTMWMAGGGVKGGTIVGATDEIGLNAIEDRAHVNDIHATILHLMGLDHKQLTFLHNGRDERLTDVAAGLGVL